MEDNSNGTRTSSELSSKRIQQMTTPLISPSNKGNGNGNGDDNYMSKSTVENGISFLFAFFILVLFFVGAIIGVAGTQTYTEWAVYLDNPATCRVTYVMVDSGFETGKFRIFWDVVIRRSTSNGPDLAINGTVVSDSFDSKSSAIGSKEYKEHVLSGIYACHFNKEKEAAAVWDTMLPNLTSSLVMMSLGWSLFLLSTIVVAALLIAFGKQSRE